MSNKGYTRIRYVGGSYGYESKSGRAVAPILLLASLCISFGVHTYAKAYPGTEAESFIAHASEPTVTDSQPVVLVEVVTPTPTVAVIKTTEKQEVINYIAEVFGAEAETAKRIAFCESGMQPNKVGDLNITTVDNSTGEVIGHSVGIFQVRTGGKERNGITWNRAKANNMSVSQFESNLKLAKYNIDYAKKIYDRSGWGAWKLCTQRIKADSFETKYQTYVSESG